MKPITSSVILLLAALALIFGGGGLAMFVQSNYGRVNIDDIRFKDDAGNQLSALLYTPATATSATPAPGVLAVHGYINSRETQSGYAIELARRGYVVLALDQRGHGYSQPPAFADGFGGPAGLNYLRGLAQVDQDQIVLIGHSMGGWTVLSAAASYPDAYSAVAISGSSTGTFGVPQGTTQFPKNLGLVFGKYDEFSGTMWGAERGADIIDTEKLKTLFGSNDAIQEKTLYGSIEAGTARKLYQPAQTHPANHITASGIGSVIDWVQLTTQAPNSKPPINQIWQWKELATALSFVGAILFLFATISLLIKTSLFAALNQQPASAVATQRLSWWLSAIVFIALPAITFFPFQQWAGKLIKTCALFPQNLTNGFMVWAMGSLLISVGLFLIWHFFLGGRKRSGNAQVYGLLWLQNSTQYFFLTILLAVISVALLYATLLINHALFTADFRWWVIALKLLSGLQMQIFFSYVIPFVLFFIGIGVVLHGQLRRRESDSLRRAMMQNALLMGGGIFILLAVQYLPLFLGHTLLIPTQALLTIVAIQFAILLPIAGLISTYCFSKTGRVYLGGTINGLLFTWLIVAGQATHYAF